MNLALPATAMPISEKTRLRNPDRPEAGTLTTTLYRVSEPEHGRCHFLTVGNNPASMSWLDDDRAADFITEPMEA
jgi:hypothetical protein